MIAFAEQRAAELDRWIGELPGTAETSAEAQVGQVGAGQEGAKVSQVVDADIHPKFRDVFIEESEEIVAELTSLTAAWCDDPQVDRTLRDIRRHFHTFKGNGRAVGANVIGELGWAAQDMLDRVLDGELMADATLQSLLMEVVDALPDLVQSYQRAEGPDLERIRRLTSACFDRAEGREISLAHELEESRENTVQPPMPAALAETVTH